MSAARLIAGFFAFALQVAMATHAYGAEPSAVEIGGKAIFRTKCGVCHMAGGTGTFMLERRLGKSQALLEERRDLNAAFIARVVRSGIQSMPRFSRAELPDRELQAVAEYLARNSGGS
ncbi:MAG TPA: cytochrome c [Steroidobacteraceae bacterium]|jgi:mono/diheme cytochrome c family protein|nr:cytochrome c [Steroidobacteraceae bacterium]